MNGVETQSKADSTNIKNQGRKGTVYIGLRSRKTQQADELKQREFKLSVS